MRCKNCVKEKCIQSNDLCKNAWMLCLSRRMVDNLSTHTKTIHRKKSSNIETNKTKNHNPAEEINIAHINTRIH